jgi:hypothetical protein
MVQNISTNWLRNLWKAGNISNVPSIIIVINKIVLSALSLAQLLGSPLANGVTTVDRNNCITNINRKTKTVIKKNQLLHPLNLQPLYMLSKPKLIAPSRLSSHCYQAWNIYFSYLPSKAILYYCQLLSSTSPINKLTAFSALLCRALFFCSLTS